jgi:ATP-binding cassette subfamily F protein uup
MVRKLFSKENITLFMVTHDRFFLERVCNEIIELDNGKYTNTKETTYLEKKKNALLQKIQVWIKQNLL